MNRKKGLLTILLLALFAGLVILSGCVRVSYSPSADSVASAVSEEVSVTEKKDDPKQEIIEEAAKESEDTETVSNLKFRNKRLLSEHFEKHGQEFPYDSEEDYLAGANKMLSNPDKLHKKEAEDGDDVYYLEATNEFIIVSQDGYIRTYFKPRRGIDYYNSQ